MRATLNYLSAACAGGLLLACGAIAPRPVAAPLAADADAAFLRGRAQQLAGSAEKARAAYDAALAADPAHLSARNGLATLSAEQGRLDEAIILWRQLIEQSGGDGPATAYLYSNLGYAYLLRGDYALALPVLERACLLDPLNHRAWRHLGNALEQLGQPERAAQMRRQALALESHDLTRDYAMTGRTGPAAVAAPGVPAPDFAQSTLREIDSGIFELRRSAAGLPASAAKSPAANPLMAKLEIRNGNGASGMARTLARGLGGPGLRVVRLSNQKGFRVAQTRIEYQGNFRAAAARLAGRFKGATVLEVSDCNSANLRLVIGRDLLVGKRANHLAGNGALAATEPKRRANEAS